MVNVGKGFPSLYYISRSTYVRPITAVLLLAMLMGCAAPKENGKTAMLDALFVKARDNTGDVYAEARDELLANGATAIVFLERKVSSRAGEQERWLAEIMLARAKKPAEFKELEKSFHKKVLVAKYADPLVISKRRVCYPERGTMLILPGELPQRVKTRIGTKDGGGYIQTEDAFFEYLRISDCPLWKALASELVLKGWTVPASSLWQPPEPASRGKYYTPPTITGPLAAVGRSGPAVLNEGDYVYQAMVLVRKLGEKRAGDRVLEVLQECTRELGWIRGFPPSAAFYDCREAVKALGTLRYKKALDTLLNLAEDEGTPIGIRQVVFPAIERIADERAIPVLERISSWSQESHRGVEQARFFASSARHIIRVIQGKEQPE